MLGYGNLLREARLSAGLTQAELAEKVGVDRTIVSKVERERISLTVAQVNALVQALPISAEQLLRAMGVHLTPPAAARLPRELVDRRGPWGADSSCRAVPEPEHPGTVRCPICGAWDFTPEEKARRAGYVAGSASATRDDTRSAPV